MRFVLIGVLGSVGALARFELSRSIHRRSNRRDLATMVVNVAGALALGLMIGVDKRFVIHPDLLAGLTIGFLGGFTTFSAWMIDVIVLSEPREGGTKSALLNLALTLGGGLVGYSIGNWLVVLV